MKTVDMMINESRKTIDKPKEALNKSVLLMAWQANNKKNQLLTVNPEPVKGFNQRLLRGCRQNKLPPVDMPASSLLPAKPKLARPRPVDHDA